MSAPLSAEQSEKAVNKHATKLVPRRIVPVIPRSLAKPRKQANGSEEKKVVKEIATPKEDAPLKEAEASVATLDAMVIKEESKEALESHAAIEEGQQEVPEDPKEDNSTVNGHESPASETLTAVSGSDDSQTLSNPNQSIKDEEAETKIAAAQVKIAAAQAKKPVHLPPAFVPSSRLNDALSSTNFGKLPLSARHQHSHIPSQDSVVLGGPALVFGGPPDSSGPSPTHMSSKNARAMGPPPLPPYGNGGHMPVPSNDYSAQVPQYPQHNMPFTPYQQYQDWSAPASAVPQPMAPPAFAPANGRNHASQTHSQASSGVVDFPKGHYLSADSHMPDSIRYGHGNSAPAQTGPQSTHHAHPSTHASSDQRQPANVDLTNLQNMQRHLTKNFGWYEFADYYLDINTGNLFPAHLLILARSPGLLAMIHATNPGDKCLQIPAECYYKVSDAFVDALRYLYLGDLLDARKFLTPIDAPNGQSSDEWAARMRYLLSYVASGLTLDVRDIHGAGIRMVQGLLRWETLEPALDFAVNSRFNYTGNIAGQHILRLVLEFIVTNFPHDFELDTTALELESFPRLPEQFNKTSSGTVQDAALLLQHRRRSTNQQLEKIRFGDAPATQMAPNMSVNAILSSVLLSLPYQVLHDLFTIPRLRERLSGAVYAQHAFTTVSEREARRVNALKGWNGEDGDSPLVANMFLEEDIDGTSLSAQGLLNIFRTPVVVGHAAAPQ